ncbi:MAG: aminoacyl-tRNA hydrolase [Candidatus Limnocylindria bacterium]
MRFPRLLRPPAPARVEHVVVGLGNPGDGYAPTRHNVGFRVVSRLARRARADFDHRAASSRIAEGRVGAVPVAIARPQTFMNDSGAAVRKLLDRYRVGPGALLVISDDIDLPLGRIRIRASGGAGTHNGMRSVVAAVGEGFARIRCGVAPADPGAPILGELADFVLAPFAAAEREQAEAMVLRAAEAAEVALRDGVARAMERFNG